MARRRKTSVTKVVGGSRPSHMRRTRRRGGRRRGSVRVSVRKR